MNSKINFDSKASLLANSRKPLQGGTKPQAQTHIAALARPVRPLIVAHRGGSLEGPENTVEAIRLSVAGGSDWQEVDVALTADNEPIILHDDTLERTTGAHGDIADWKAADVLRLHAGNPQWADDTRATMSQHGITNIPNFSGKYDQAKVPSLADVLAVPKARLMLELKATTKPATMATKVLGAIDAAQAWSRVAIASFDLEILQEIHAQAPLLPRIGLAEDMEQVGIMLKEQVNILGVAVGLVHQSAQLLPPQVALWAWTVYTEPMARQAMADGAHAIIADNPISLLRALEQDRTLAKL